MKKAASYFLGRHDFRAFSAKSGSLPVRQAGASGGKDNGDEKKNTVRSIKNIFVQKKGSIIRIGIEGDGFLTHMVRIMAGTLMEVGKGKISPEKIPAILRSADRKQAGPTAKPQGLTLTKVLY